MIYLNLSGGLGNQLFEYAFARSIQAKTGQKLTLNPYHFDSHGHNTLQLDQLNIPSDILITQSGPYGKINLLQKLILQTSRKIYEITKRYLGVKTAYKIENAIEIIDNAFGIYQERSGPVNIWIPRYIIKNISISGYWQSPKYFDFIQDQLKSEITPKLPKDLNLNTIVQSINAAESVCLHIRRGDYIGHANHQVCDLKYYFNAIQIMNNMIDSPLFCVFSDDIEWARRALSIDDQFIFSDVPKSPVDELSLMCRCKHFILSNSSYSWWAQYLSKNPEKRVIAPSKWNNSGSPVQIYEDNWFIIDV